jgi:hypothetical protein
MFEPLIRRGWQIGGSITAVVVLVMGTAQTMGAVAHEEHSTVQRFNPTGLRLVEIDNSAAGKVRVVGSDTDQIVVRTEISDGLQETRHSERIDGERLLLESRCPFLSDFCEVRYEVEMPADLRVKVWSPASVSVEDITADVEVKTDESIEVARLGGRLDAHAVSGSITARDLRSSDVGARATDGSILLDFARSPLGVRAESTDGNIEVLVPQDDELYKVHTDTVDGTTSVQVANGPDGDRSITGTTTDGDVVLRYRS